MARKKAGKKSSARKPAGTKPAARKKTVRKQAAKKAASPRKAPAGRTGAGGKRKKVAKRAPTLGRARIPADARLDLVFQKDYQAREVFEFLRVETVRELEQHRPAEIIEKLTTPMVQTVQRIRKALALYNRCLADDQEFAAAFKAEFVRR